VALKRELWAKLLRTAFGSAFTDDPDLFIDHTLLVLSAEIIAHAALGFDLSDPSITPKALVRGDAFANSQIYGVVEADFFDWVLDAPGGERFVETLARRLWRFDWAAVEHDVLKILYESIIHAEDRRKLGEYYTPDWLADRIVYRNVTDPLNQRVLDPACGSGTFLFHAVKAFLLAAGRAGLDEASSLSQLTNHVIGLDVHPVAVTLARVTYLLAIGADRLSGEQRPSLTIPVYLGDSMQWDQRTDILGPDAVTIRTAGADLAEAAGGALFGDELVFPKNLLSDASMFDSLVSELADRATQYRNGGSYPSLNLVIKKYGIHPHDVNSLTATFRMWCNLHAEGRDHVWGYYVRNLVRPLWLAEDANKVDVLLGNPPWLRYNNMTGAMQNKFKDMSQQRGLLTGGLGASARDLSALFVVRCVELYLCNTGNFSFVMPYATLSRKPYAGFRRGTWKSPEHPQLAVSFDKAWDLHEVRPDIFPVPAAVVGGRLTPIRPRAISSVVEAWSGRLATATTDWQGAEPYLRTRDQTVQATSQDELGVPSPYKSRFRDGAILYPRVFMFVDDMAAGPLGAGPGRRRVQSRRSTQEKKPWKDRPSLRGNIEKQFILPTHLGETLAPYRMLPPLNGVLPLKSNRIMNLSEIEEYPGLDAWWKIVEDTWRAYSAEDSAPLLERIDYHNQLSAQLPASPNRVVYSKAGNTLAAARLNDRSAIIDHKLYWCAASSPDEARYLVGILNSHALLERVTPLQSRGLFGPRDFDKNVFRIHIPLFDRRSNSHSVLAATVKLAEDAAAAVDLTDEKNFTMIRRKIRTTLAASGLQASIEQIVDEILPPVALP
jgi:SAM-dependent methyltransferase